MPSRHSHDDRRFARRDEPNPMPKKNLAHVELLRGAFRHQTHLMFGHRSMRFVIDAFNLPPIFRRADRAPKNDDRASLRILVSRGQIERRFCD